ncbi:hypothetical protein BVG16_22525 [Paenibacillus selenitireducens]|uniref:DUF402 domain-containing protein n=1 Tax=Paenibacillus selenitireducens TaxID=1324314 RepID=A0A1T2X6D1_9BACL|nr:hypothetical protein BVG16_22525 [Paenibacillus selenitireducens]
MAGVFIFDEWKTGTFRHKFAQSFYCKKMNAYVDISKSIGVSEQGIPFWDDLYLDVVVFPNGDFNIKDEDELEEALNNNHIKEDDYRLAKSVMNDLIKEINAKENAIIKNSLKHFEIILMASQGTY